jgi:hypothetical protein
MTPTQSSSPSILPINPLYPQYPLSITTPAEKAEYDALWAIPLKKYPATGSDKKDPRYPNQIIKWTPAELEWCFDQRKRKIQWDPIAKQLGRSNQSCRLQGTKNAPKEETKARREAAAKKNPKAAPTRRKRKAKVLDEIKEEPTAVPSSPEFDSEKVAAGAIDQFVARGEDQTPEYHNSDSEPASSPSSESHPGNRMSDKSDSEASPTTALPINPHWNPINPQWNPPESNVRGSTASEQEEIISQNLARQAR